MAAAVAFEAVVMTGHKGPAVEVPFDPRAKWAAAAVPLRPGRRGVPVHATLDGVAFDGAIVARSGRHWLPLPPEIDATAGARVTVRVAPLTWPATTTAAPS